MAKKAIIKIDNTEIEVEVNFLTVGPQRGVKPEDLDSISMPEMARYIGRRFEMYGFMTRFTSLRNGG